MHLLVIVQNKEKWRLQDLFPRGGGVWRCTKFSFKVNLIRKFVFKFWYIFFICKHFGVWPLCLSVCHYSVFGPYVSQCVIIQCLVLMSLSVSLFSVCVSNKILELCNSPGWGNGIVQVTRPNARNRDWIWKSDCSQGYDMIRYDIWYDMIWYDIYLTAIG